MKRVLVIIALSIAVLIAGYLLYRYFFYTCCPPASLPASENSETDKAILKDPNLLFARLRWAGLCSSKEGEHGGCYWKTYLCLSGKLVEESGWTSWDGTRKIAYPTLEKAADENLMNQITKHIRDSGILRKPCEMGPTTIADYGIDYFVNLDGVKRELRFPQCESELKEIDKLIDAANS